MHIRSSDISDRQELENFLVAVNGGQHEALAGNYLDWAFSGHFRRPRFFVALEKEKIIGAAAISEETFTIGVWGISWVSVAERDRRRGIGRALVEYCLASIQELAGNRACVILNTYPEKTGLYDKTGFLPLGNDSSGGSLMIQHIGGEQRA